MTIYQIICVNIHGAIETNEVSDSRTAQDLYVERLGWLQKGGWDGTGLGIQLIKITMEPFSDDVRSEVLRSEDDITVPSVLGQEEEEEDNVKDVPKGRHFELIRGGKDREDE